MPDYSKIVKGLSALKKAPQAEAMRLAQQRAALSPAKGGLGLPADNTPAQRAKAMGFDTDVYHGSRQDFSKFKGDQPVFAAENPDVASKYGNAIYPLKLRGKELEISDLGKDGTSGWFANNLAKELKIPKKELEDLKMPRGEFNDSFMDKLESLWIKKFGDTRFSDIGERAMVNKLPKHGIDRLKVNDMSDMGGTQTQHMIPAESDNIRSRFAAFDPFRKDAATAAAMGVVAPDLLAEEKAKGGAIRMQVGGLSALANVGKAGTLANRLSRSESAGMRARQFADPLNPDDIMRMSEALGYAGAEGKTLNLTQADRSRVFGPNKGGTGFSGLQLTSPEHKKAKSTWGVGKPSHLTRLTKATDDDTIWSTFIGSPTQHMSNPVTTQRMYEAHRKGNPSAKLVEDMNKMLNKAVDDKTGKPMFPNGIDISDPSSLNQAQTFNQRKLLAKAMVMGGEKKGEKATQEAFRIIKEETDPLLMESPTYAIGNRLFTIDKNSGLYRPDLNSAFPYISTGDDLGLLFEPAPLKLAAPQFVNQEKYLNRLDKNGNPSPISHKDLSSTTPKQFISEEYLTNLQKEGYKDGGSAEPAPFHDFDQIMKRKDGGTVNTTFEQRLKSAIEKHMAGGGVVERHYAEAGSVPAPTPQELEKMADAQGAAFGVFPQMANKRFFEETKEGKLKKFLEEKYKKEQEGFATEEARRDRLIKTVTPVLGAGADLGNFAANIPHYLTEGVSAAGNYAMSKVPSMSKPASVLDTEGKGDRVSKYPLQSLPEFDPFYGSAAMQRDAQNAGLMGDSESPIYDTAMAFLSPYAAVKAPKIIKGGLQMAKESPTLQKGAEYAGRGYSLAKVPVQRQFTPATATVEATAPDLGQGTTYGFRQGLNDVLLENPKLGTGRNKMREGQGTFTNTKEELELNPLLAIDVPRAGSIGDVPNANKALRQQMAQMGVDLNQEAMAAHRFIPLATNNVRDASSALIKTKEGLTADEVAELAKALGGKMAVTHNPRLGGVVVFPFGSVKEGLIPRELLRAQQAAEKLLGKRGEVQFGISDFGKDRAYMLAKEGDYAKAGAKPMSKEQQAQRERLQGLEKFLFPESRSGIPGQVKAAPVGGLQPWSVGPEYPTSVIGIGNGSRVQYQPRNFSTGQQGSKYDKYLEAEAEREKMLDEFHRALVPKYR
jgi:hypothetical protein